MGEDEAMIGVVGAVLGDFIVGSDEDKGRVLLESFPARNGAIKARTSASNQLHSLCDTAPERIRAQLRGLGLRQKVAVCVCAKYSSVIA